MRIGRDEISTEIPDASRDPATRSKPRSTSYVAPRVSTRIGSYGVAVHEEGPAVLARAPAPSRLVQRLEADAALPLQQVARRVSATRTINVKDSSPSRLDPFDPDVAERLKIVVMIVSSALTIQADRRSTRDPACQRCTPRWPRKGPSRRIRAGPPPRRDLRS